MKRITGMLLAVGIFAMFSLVSRTGWNEEQDAQADYCYKVENAIWPDYNGTYKKECGGKNPPKFRKNV